MSEKGGANDDEKNSDSNSSAKGDQQNDGSKRCINCNPKRPMPTNIVERAKHFQVKAEGRKCTDCWCCVVYISFVAIWVGVAGAALYFGNVYSIYYGRDHQNLLCGVDHNRSYAWWKPPADDWGLEHTHNFVGKNLVYYPRLKDDLIDYAKSLGADLSSLKVTEFSYQQLMNITLTGVCVRKCPVYGQVICTNDFELKTRKQFLDNNGKHCNEDIDGQCKPLANTVAQCRGKESFGGLIKNLYYYLNQELCTNCWITPINTTKIFHRCLEIIWTKKNKNEKCIFPRNKRIVNGVEQDIPPGDPAYILASDDQCITKSVLDNSYAERPAYDNPVAELLGDALATMSGWLTDAINSFYVVLVCGCVIAMILGFLWIILLRWVTGFIVWSTIVMMLVILLILAAWCWLSSGWIPSHLLAGWLAETFNTMGVGDVKWLNSISTFFNNTFAGCANGTATSCGVTMDANSVSSVNSIAIDMGSKLSMQTYYQIFAVTFTVLFVTGVVIIAVLGKKIAIAISIIEEAANAVMRMPCMLAVPFFTAVFLLINFLWFIGMGLLIHSLRDLQVADVIDGVTGFVNDRVGNCTGGAGLTLKNITIQEIENWKKVDPALPAAAAACSGLGYLRRWGDLPLNDAFIVFHIFCFLWTNMFLQGITIMVVAGAVADWYWTRPSGPDESDEKCSCCRKLPCMRLVGYDPTMPYKGGDGQSFQKPLAKSIYRTFRFHLGSVAFGSFLIALVQMIRLTLEYIKKQTQGWAEKNKLYRILLKVISVILYCFEKCLKYITRNAYIMIAMRGHGFCNACCHAFKLLLPNLVQFVLVSCFSKVVTTLGKVAIMASSMILTYIWLSTDPKFQEVLPTGKATSSDGYAGTASVTNRAIPLALVALLAYGSAAAFLHVYDLAIGTILMCFCEDFKVHQVDDHTQEALHREVYMPNSLRKIVLSSKEFKHMQYPLTQEQLMEMAGIDPAESASDEHMSYPEIIEFCKRLLLKSHHFVHLHTPASQLTERMIIDNTGGTELDDELKKHKNPDYDPQYAERVQYGHKKANHHDKRVFMYKPQLTKMDVIDIIDRAGLLHSHGHTLNQKDIIEHASVEHGPELAKQMSITLGHEPDNSVKLFKRSKVCPKPTDSDTVEDGDNLYRKTR